MSTHSFDVSVDPDEITVQRDDVAELLPIVRAYEAVIAGQYHHRQTTAFVRLRNAVES